MATSPLTAILATTANDTSIGDIGETGLIGRYGIIGGNDVRVSGAPDSFILARDPRLQLRCNYGAITVTVHSIERVEALIGRPVAARKRGPKPKQKAADPD